MQRIVVLGAAGGVGRMAARTLVQIGGVDEIVVADLAADAVTALASELGAGDRVRPAAVDITDEHALDALLGDSSVVLNCVGPFYRFGPPTLRAALRAGVGYVDICDDLDATEALLAMHDEARAAGVTALIGMGNSPGLANLFVKLCAETLLDEVTSADICHVHGGEPSEGAAVLKHRIHAMIGDVPLFVDGRMVAVRQLEESGAAHVRDVDFEGFGTRRVWPYPHPETITLPEAFPSLRRVTNLGSVYPKRYFEMTQELVRAGMASEDAVVVHGTEVAPIDVMVALLQRERPALLAAEHVSQPGGCLQVEIGGVRDGAQQAYVFSLTSTGAGAGEGTGIPAALGAALHLRGALGDHPGVHPPEAIVPVEELLALAGAVLPALSIGDGDGVPLTVTHVASDGTRSVVPLDLS